MPAREGSYRLGYLIGLFAALALVGCSPTFPISDSTALGTFSLAWDVGAKASFSSLSQTLVFTPLTYTDLDDLKSYRYLSATFRVENRGNAPLANLTLRAYASSKGLGGTAVEAIQTFDGTNLRDPRVAQNIKPIQGTQAGPSGPQPDPDNSSFQGFSSMNSAGLQRTAQLQGLLGSEQVLDYGFSVAASDLQPGATSLLCVAFRVPRGFSDTPQPYRFRLSFLLTTSPVLRVSQALGETADQALKRAESLLTEGVEVELGLLDDAPPATLPGLSVARLGNLRIGTATYLK